MPKSRNGSGAGATVPFNQPDEVFELAPAPEAEEVLQEESAVLQVPVYRDGMDDRLSAPLSRVEEVPRFNALWERFQAGDRLSPEELGELHEYVMRRLNYPIRDFTRSRTPENAFLLLSRAQQVEAVERAAGRSFMQESHLRTIGEAREIAESLDADSAFVPLSRQENRLFQDYCKKWERGEDIPDGDLRAARVLAIRRERNKYRELLGMASGGAPLADLASAYAEHQDAAEFISYLDNKIRNSEPGFSAPEPFSADRFHETIDYLRRRAGPINDINFPTGRVIRFRDARKERIPEPRQIENPPRVVFLVPPNLASARLREHAETLGIRVVNGTEIPPDADVVVNWGFKDVEFPEHFRILNRAGSGVASDKAECLKRLGDLAPRTTRDWRLAPLLGDRVVGKISKGAARGSGKEVLEIGTETADRRNYRYDLFQEFFPERDEYRVVLLGDKVLTAHSKNAVPGTLPENMAPRREYVRLDGMPRGVLEMAREARRRVGVELAGVDIIRDRQTGRWYVLEVNAAPGMSEATMRRLVEELAADRG